MSWLGEDVLDQTQISIETGGRRKAGVGSGRSAERERREARNTAGLIQRFTAGSKFEKRFSR